MITLIIGNIAKSESLLILSGAGAVNLCCQADTRELEREEREWKRRNYLRSCTESQKYRSAGMWRNYRMMTMGRADDKLRSILLHCKPSAAAVKVRDDGIVLWFSFSVLTSPTLLCSRSSIIVEHLKLQCLQSRPGQALTTPQHCCCCWNVGCGCCCLQWNLFLVSNCFITMKGLWLDWTLQWMLDILKYTMQCFCSESLSGWEYLTMRLIVDLHTQDCYNKLMLRVLVNHLFNC